MWVIVNRYRDAAGSVVLSGCTGPFGSEPAALAYNLENYPSPEFNRIVRFYEPASSDVRTTDG